MSFILLIFVQQLKTRNMKKSVLNSLVDVLTNAMEIINMEEFIQMFSDELEEERLKNLWNKYWELLGYSRFFNSSEDWENFILETY